MIGRIFAIALAALGGAFASQAPEFTQQYQQRLGGAVDELARVVADFDRSAEEEGLDRAAALAQMTGTPFVERRRAAMAETIARHERLSTQLADLRLSETGIGRVIALIRRPDADLAERVWSDYQVAVPVTVAGFAFTAAGAAIGWIVALLLCSAFRKRPARIPAATAATARRGLPPEPPLTRKP